MRRMLFAALLPRLSHVAVRCRLRGAEEPKAKLEVISSHQNQVSGGDALMRVTLKSEPLYHCMCSATGWT